jgi:parallel beta-helix repeat protein
LLVTKQFKALIAFNLKKNMRIKKERGGLIKSTLFAFFIFLTLIVIFMVMPSLAIECGSVLTDNCDITHNITFIQGNYSLPNGINLKTNNLVLDRNGSILNGTRALYQYGIKLNGNYDNNLVTNCTVMNYDAGIFLQGGSYNGPDSNKLTKNLLEYNNDGIYMLTRVRYSEIFKNKIQNNSKKGIELGFSDYVEFNKIWNNNFINNTLPAFDSGYPGVINYWNYSGQGNYWSDYNTEAEGCYDNNSDLSCDAPYN